MNGDWILAAPEPLIEVRGLRKYFPVHRGLLYRKVGDVRAVDGVSFDVGRGRTLSLVGESGCGKTTVGRSLLRLIRPTAGRARFHREAGQPPVELFDLPSRELRRIRGELQIIFQDPYSSLNPRLTVGQIVGESLAVHRIARGQELDDRVEELLIKVGLRAEARNRYPHEFSGGQRQRIGVARALALGPRFIVCDEAVSALDVSIQAQVINLLSDLQEEFGLSYLFIAHDLAVVRHISDHVAVMYLGRLVEIGSVEQVFEDPSHPYTRALLSAIPQADPAKRGERVLLEGEVPSAADPPRGCHFHTRCPLAEARCRVERPQRVRVEEGHVATCHLLEGERGGTAVEDR